VHNFCGITLTNAKEAISMCEEKLKLSRRR